MSPFNVLIILIASVSGLPTSNYQRRDNFGYEVTALEQSGLLEPSGAGSSPVKTGKQPKNSAGESKESGYYKQFGTNADGEKGFESGTYSHGQNGYKELDTFHKQIGDKYGFEENLEFGHGKGNQNSGKHSRARESKSEDADEAGTSVETFYADTNGSGEYLGGGETYSSGGDGDNYEYSSGDSGEGAYSESSSYSSNDGDKSGSDEYYY
ncbi:uncharacterized protein [Fopius arisanus]|uniref:Uncharacterized protein n=1 Tax=Fopius arisanus TaxID=64838 RepID=A0A0C9RNJ3_9HYME|nr:PREDICTED: uncharacterized protein LOC105266417 [Fopius arisanus]